MSGLISGGMGELPASGGGSGVATTYQIPRSLRLRNTYLTRTWPSQTDVRKFTISAWVKKAGIVGNSYALLGWTDAVSTQGMWYPTAAQTTIGGGSQTASYSGGQYADSTAWQHVVWHYDSNNATPGLRARVWINGVEQVLSGTLQGSASPITVGGAVGINIRRFGASGDTLSEMYIAAYHFIDGQLRPATDFGEFDANSGTWVAKGYTGTYGAGGFRLMFDDTSSVANLGLDSSGNGIHWTPTGGVSLTAGRTYDSMLDVPLGAGGSERGSYATLNPLVNSNSLVTISAAALECSVGAADKIAHATIAIPTTGKWYWEYAVVTVGAWTGTGVVNAATLQQYSGAGFAVAETFHYSYNGTPISGATYTTGDIIGVAVDCTTNFIRFYKNNVYQGQTAITPSTKTLAPSVYMNSSSGAFNFGQRPFTYTPPTGFKALHTGNFPDPAVLNSVGGFAAVDYAGNGTSQSLVPPASITPALAWFKRRAAIASHALYDTARGVQNRLESNNINGQTTGDAGVTAFNSNGVSLGSNALVNASAVTFMAYLWEAGATPGFDVRAYSHTTGTPTVVNHGLGVAPACYIEKTANVANQWNLSHKSLGTVGDAYLVLNSTAIAATGLGQTVSGASVTIPAARSTSTGVLYLWAEVEGFSKFGKYTANGAVNGPYCYCGFRPRFIIVKKSTASAAYWYMFDTVRGQSNSIGPRFRPNTDEAEVTFAAIDVMGLGFKIISTDIEVNASGAEYVFMAFADQPGKYALTRN